jgi:hypothetical protein
MEQSAHRVHSISFRRFRIHPLTWLAELRRNNTLGQVSAVLVFIGLAFAMATDGELSLLWSRLLFGALIILDVLMVDWLIR